MCNCSQLTGNNLSGSNNGLSGNRYSNLTTEEADMQCLQEWETHPTAYGGDLAKCREAKKAASVNKYVGYVDQGSKVLSQIQTFLGVFSNKPAPPTGPYEIPESPTKSGLGIGAWIGIIGGVLVLVTVSVLIVKSGKSNTTKPIGYGK